MSNRPAVSAHTRRAMLSLASGLLALVGTSAQAQSDINSPEDFIQRVGQQVVAILKDQSLSTPQKVSRLKQLLNQSTDLTYVARIIMGRHWRQATPQQQQDYLRLFDALVLETMAERIGSYAGQTFGITGSRKVDEQDTVVSTEITQPSGGPPYRVDWRVRKSGPGKYQLIDIVAEGVSLVITQRAEVNEIVNQRGIDGLLAEMRRRIEERNPTAPKPS